MRFPDYPVAGEPLRESWGRTIVDYLRSITLRPSPDVWPNMGAGGTTLRILRGAGLGRRTFLYAKPFDITDVTDNSFSLLRNSANAGWLWIAGRKITVIAVDGMTWDAENDDRWLSGEITGAQAVWLELDRPNNTVTLFMDTALPDDADPKYDNIEIHPLWLIPWDDVNDVIGSDIIDLRDAVRLPAMA